jgi:hypothetical protein
MVLAANFRAARARAGLGQELTAARMRALGFAEWRYQTVGVAEKGKRRLTAEEVMALAWVFDVTVFELMKPPESAGPVEFPSGERIAAHSVAASIGAYNDGAVTWDGAEPKVSVTELDQTISIIRNPRPVRNRPARRRRGSAR